MLVLDELKPQAPTIARELGQSLVLLALTGSSIGGVMIIVALAARALGR